MKAARLGTTGRNTDGPFNDTEVHFTGSTVLDNGRGLELGVGTNITL